LGGEASNSEQQQKQQQQQQQQQQRQPAAGSLQPAANGSSISISALGISPPTTPLAEDTIHQA